MKQNFTTALKSLALTVLLLGGITYAWTGPTATAPNNNTDTPINVGSLLQEKEGPLHVDNIFSAVSAVITGSVGIGDSTPDGALKLDVEGKVGATEYCDQNGANCVTPTAMGGGVTKVYSCPVTAQKIYGACPGSGCIGELSTKSTCTVKYSTSYNNVCRVDAGTIATKVENCTYIGKLSPM